MAHPRNLSILNFSNYFISFQKIRKNQKFAPLAKKTEQKNNKNLSLTLRHALFYNN